MFCLKKRSLVLVLLIAFSLTTMSIPAMAEDSVPDAMSMIGDFVILRPLGIAATAVGCALFVVTLPFTVWSSKRVRATGNNFVVLPGKVTFVRPLGELS